ncbi:MAG TPA: hypothetical protein VF331_01205 [Polyangiales bacterium]
MGPSAPRSVWLLVGIFACLALSSQAGRAQAQDLPNKKGSRAECVHSRAEARFNGYGYDHWVHLDNACKSAMACSVKTNSNPAGTGVDLAPGEQKSVMAFMGSPAREFTVDVSCRPHG